MDSEIDFHEAFRRVQRLFIEGKRWQCIRVGKEVLSENTIPPLLRIKIICIPANAEVNQRDADVWQQKGEILYALLPKAEENDLEPRRDVRASLDKICGYQYWKPLVESRSKAGAQISAASLGRPQDRLTQLFEDKKNEDEDKDMETDWEDEDASQWGGMDDGDDDESMAEASLEQKATVDATAERAATERSAETGKTV